MSKIFTLFTLIILSIIPLSSFSDPVPPVFCKPDDLHNYYTSVKEKLPAIEIGTVLCDEAGPSWDESKIWFDDHHKLFFRGYDLAATDVYLNLYDIEMARRMIVELPHVKSLTILCHTHFDTQSQESFKPVIAEWAKAGKKLNVYSVPEETRQVFVRTCFQWALGITIFEGFDPQQASNLKQQIKKSVDAALFEFASAGVKINNADEEKIRFQLCEKLLIKASRFCLPNMHLEEKADIVRVLLKAHQEEWSEAFQQRLVGFIQKRSAVWQQRTPKCDRDDYAAIIDTLRCLNDGEIDQLLTMVETDFNHVVQNIAPFVNLIAQILYPGRFKGHDSIYERADIRLPTKGTATYLRKYKACLEAFPLAKMPNAAALGLIESYFMNPIDDKFYKWGAQLYEFGAELGQEFAKLPEGKQEDAFLLAREFRDMAFPKLSKSDHDDEPDLYSEQVLEDWIEILQIICFIVQETNLSSTRKPEEGKRFICTEYGGTVTTLAAFYKKHNRLPFSLGDFHVFSKHERLQVLEKINPLFNPLNVSRMQISLLFETFKKLREWNEDCSDDKHLEYLKIIWPVFAYAVNDMQHFLVSLPVDQRAAFLEKSRRVLEDRPANWQQRLMNLKQTHQEFSKLTSQAVQQDKKGTFRNPFGKK